MNKKKIKKITENKNLHIFVILMIAAIVLVLPYLIGLEMFQVSGEQSYYHLRAAESILQGNFEDDLIYGGRSLVAGPFDYFLAGTVFLLGQKIAVLVVPFILGLTSVFFFIKLLRRFEIEQKRLFFISLMLILNPVFVYTFKTLNADAFAISLTLAGFYFFMKKSKSYMFSSILFLSVASLNSIFNGLIILTVLFLYSFKNEKKQNWFLLQLIVTLFLVIFFNINFYTNFELSEQANIIRNLVSDFGGMVGMGIFNLMLAMIGLILSWRFIKRQKKQYVVILIVIALILTSKYTGKFINIYSNFVISFFGGYCIARILKLEWSYDLIKRLTMILIVCGVLFSVVSYVNRLSEITPAQEEIDSLSWLKNNSEPGSLILSHHSNGYLIEFFSRRPVLIDGIYEKGKYNELSDMNAILSARSLKTPLKLFEQYNIKYVWINNKMKSELWENKETEFLYLLTNSETFKKVFSNSQADIYRIESYGEE